MRGEIFVFYATAQPDPTENIGLLGAPGDYGNKITIKSKAEQLRLYGSHLLCVFISVVVGSPSQFTFLLTPYFREHYIRLVKIIAFKLFTWN